MWGLFNFMKVLINLKNSQTCHMGDVTVTGCVVDQGFFFSWSQNISIPKKFCYVAVLCPLYLLWGVCSSCFFFLHLIHCKCSNHLNYLSSVNSVMSCWTFLITPILSFLIFSFLHSAKNPSLYLVIYLLGVSNVQPYNILHFFSMKFNKNNMAQLSPSIFIYFLLIFSYIVFLMESRWLTMPGFTVFLNIY